MLNLISDEALMGEVAYMAVECISWNRGNWVMRSRKRFLRAYPNCSPTHLLAQRFKSAAASNLELSIISSRSSAVFKLLSG